MVIIGEHRTEEPDGNRPDSVIILSPQLLGILAEKVSHLESMNVNSDYLRCNNAENIPQWAVVGGGAPREIRRARYSPAFVAPFFVQSDVSFPLDIVRH